MVYTITLPDINDFLPLILGCESTIENITKDKTTKKIIEWMNEYRKEITQNRKKSKDEIFFIFVTNLLARTSNEKWWQKIQLWLNSLEKIENVNQNAIRPIEFKKRGYRFPQAGVNVVLEARRIFEEKYKSDWEYYFEKADDNFESDFIQDDFLNIKYVKHKVRDLALSNFSFNYIAIDSHVIDVLRRTGLIAYSYNYGIELSTDNMKNYLSIRDLCLRLSKTTKFSLGELDRAFWHFGRTICSGKPKCNVCPVNNKCLFYSKK